MDSDSQRCFGLSRGFSSTNFLDALMMLLAEDLIQCVSDIVVSISAA